jgi:hypothetical protein
MLVMELTSGTAIPPRVTVRRRARPRDQAITVFAKGPQSVVCREIDRHWNTARDCFGVTTKASWSQRPTPAATTRSTGTPRSTRR